jgi:hypothetical protein
MASFAFPSDPYGTFLRSPEDQAFVDKLRSIIDTHKPNFHNLTTWDGSVWTPISLADKICSEAVAAAKTEEPWGSIQTVNTDTTLESRVDETGYSVFRIKKTMNGPKEAILDLVTKAVTLGDMDDTVRVLQPVHVYSERMRLVYNITRMGSIFYDRDFFDFVCERNVNNALVSCAVSCPTSLPDADNIIRGWTMKWGLVLEDVEGESKKTHLTLVCQAAVNGWMPCFVTNMATGQVLANNYIAQIETRLKNSEAKN